MHGERERGVEREMRIRWLWSYLPNPSARAGYDTRSIFKRSLTGLNSEFSFSQTSCLTKAEEISLPYYLPIAGGRIIEFIPFPMVLWEMQSVSSRFWTRVTVSISYDDNHYTTSTTDDDAIALIINMLEFFFFLNRGFYHFLWNIIQMKEHWKNISIIYLFIVIVSIYCYK